MCLANTRTDSGNLSWCVLSLAADAKNPFPSTVLSRFDKFSSFFETFVVFFSVANALQTRRTFWSTVSFTIWSTQTITYCVCCGVVHYCQTTLCSSRTRQCLVDSHLKEHRQETHLIPGEYWFDCGSFVFSLPNLLIAHFKSIKLIPELEYDRNFMKGNFVFSFGRQHANFHFLVASCSLHQNFTGWHVFLMMRVASHKTPWPPMCWERKNVFDSITTVCGQFKFDFILRLLLQVVDSNFLKNCWFLRSCTRSLYNKTHV